MNHRKVMADWTEWIRSAESLLRALTTQEQALIARDMEKLEACTSVVESCKTALEEADKRARGSLSELADRLGVGKTMREVARKLPNVEAQQLLALASRVTELGDALRSSFVRNHALIQNELAYVNGTMTLVAEALRDPSNPYANTTPEAITLDRRV